MATGKNQMLKKSRRTGDREDRSKVEKTDAWRHCRRSTQQKINQVGALFAFRFANAFRKAAAISGRDLNAS